MDKWDEIAVETREKWTAPVSPDETRDAIEILDAVISAALRQHVREALEKAATIVDRVADDYAEGITLSDNEREIEIYSRAKKSAMGTAAAIRRLKEQECPQVTKSGAISAKTTD